METEKLALERENKKLRSELRDMQERIERKGRPLSNSDAELRHLQQELSDKTKVCFINQTCQIYTNQLFITGSSRIKTFPK